MEGAAVLAVVTVEAAVVTLVAAMEGAAVMAVVTVAAAVEGAAVMAVEGAWWWWSWSWRLR